MTINEEVLERFLDSDGRVKQMPSKYEKKLNVIYYLASKFVEGSLLSELEVNKVIKEWITFSDHVTLRRFLVDMKYLQRTKDGKKYEVKNYETDWNWAINIKKI